MVRIAPIRLSFNPKTLWFDAGDFELHTGDHVVVTTARGSEFGTVSNEVFDMTDEDVKNLKSPLKPVKRLADDNDVARSEERTRPTCSCGKRCEVRPLFNESERPTLLSGELIPGAPDPRRRLAIEESDVFDSTPEEREPRRTWATREEDGDREEPPTLVCHVCSEAFRPVFPRRCEWCDYDFGEGETYREPGAENDAEIDDFLRRKEQEEQEAFEPDSKRIMWVCVAIVAGLLAFLAYWASIF